MSPDSRVWVYLSDRAFDEAETARIERELAAFTAGWTAHDQKLKARGEVLYHRFVVLTVDETQAGASGCSIDKSVHFMQELGERHGAGFFNRMLFAWQEGDAVSALQAPEFRQAYAQGQIHDDTLVFDTLVKTLADFETSWRKPLAQSWHKRFV